MTEIETTPTAPAPLTLIGEAAGTCDGDCCSAPSHPEQALINAALDNDLV